MNSPSEHVKKVCIRCKVATPSVPIQRNVLIPALCFCFVSNFITIFRVSFFDVQNDWWRWKATIWLYCNSAIGKEEGKERIPGNDVTTEKAQRYWQPRSQDLHPSQGKGPNTLVLFTTRTNVIYSLVKATLLKIFL